MADDVRFMDFSLSPEPVTFRIAPDVFEGYPEIPLDVLADLADAASAGGTGRERMQQMVELFAGVLTPASFATFRARMRKATDDEPNPYPIGMRHIVKVLPWLMEEYGLRPTQPSDESPGGSDETDTSSTAGVSLTDSTSSD